MKRITTDKPREVLSLWQDRFARAKANYEPERERFREREILYRGINDTTKLQSGEKRETPHLYNIIAECIEAQVDCSIPPVKVSAGRKGNESKAKKIEHRLNDIILRLPSEELTDLAARTVPIQGGSYWHPEWDENLRTHLTNGDVSLSYRHPNNIIPQEAVTNLDDSDYIFVEYGATRASVENEYDVELDEAFEEDPSARSVVGEYEPTEDFVTVRTAYFYNDNGGVGKIVWTGDTLLFYMDDYEIRHLECCAECGEEKPLFAEEEKRGLFKKNKVICPRCGKSKWVDKPIETETLRRDVFDEDGKVRIPAGTEIPVYRPKTLPIILQKSISAPGQLLGVSDVDLIEDQQKTINLCEKEILERTLSCGAYVVLPPYTDVYATEGIRTFRPNNPADADQIRAVDIQFNVSQIHAVMANTYEEARHLIGVTDSYQGRYDSSAKSGVAKQASAAQAAGRFQSKRIMQAAAWARIYEYMFKLLLAYDDDIRDVFYRDDNGDMVSETFNRFDFLEKDEDGELYWDDSYRFSCESSISLMSDRETLYQQIFNNYGIGAYGPVGDIDALIYMWKQLEFLHYPLAGQTLRYMQAKKEKITVPPVIPTDGGAEPTGEEIAQPINQ